VRDLAAAQQPRFAAKIEPATRASPQPETVTGKDGSVKSSDGQRHDRRTRNRGEDTWGATRPGATSVQGGCGEIVASGRSMGILRALDTVF